MLADRHQPDHVARIRPDGRSRPHSVLGNNHYDGSLQASIDLAAPPPACLSGWDWVAWRDWPTDFAGRFIDPGDGDVAHGSFLLTTVRLLFTLRTPVEFWPCSRSVGAIGESAALTVADLVRPTQRHHRPGAR